MHNLSFKRLTTDTLLAQFLFFKMYTYVFVQKTTMFLITLLK